MPQTAPYLGWFRDQLVSEIQFSLPVHCWCEAYVMRPGFPHYPTCRTHGDTARKASIARDLAAQDAMVDFMDGAE